MNTSPIRSLQQVCQDIKYTGTETEFSTKIVGEDVTIHCRSGTHSQGSSKIKLIDRTDYNWEMGFYPGQLVSAHIGGKVIAYAIKGKEGGMVRVTNQETNQRALIKIPKNDIKDVSFAVSKQQIVLGLVDEEGNVLIHEIIDEINEIKYNLLLHIYHPNSLSSTPVNYRIIWCLFNMSFYDEEADSSDDPEKMFVVLNGNKAEIWNFGIINANYGNGPIKPSDCYEGYVDFTYTADLVDASFSSDGTAIALACTDGYVKFLQIYMIDDVKLKCLHEWQPHKDTPLSSIIFVDSLHETSTQCWKFTITGAHHNSELKLWSCESWTCLQQIHFKADPLSPISNLYLKMLIDNSGQFLIINDMNNKSMYILQLKRDDESREIYVTMLSQFLLPTRFLSYYITEVNTRQLPYSCMNESNEDLYNNLNLNNHDVDDDDDEDEDDYDDDSIVLSILIKMLVIQQKKFQECNIMFQPEAILSNESSKISENTNIILNDFNEKLPKLDDLQSSVTLLIQQQTNKTTQLNLIDNTDDDDDDNTNSNILNNNNTEMNSTINNNNEQSNKLDNGVENLIDFQHPQKDLNNFASGGSSPSREVQEILSLNNSTYSNQDYFDNLTKIQSQQQEQDDDIDDEEIIIPEKDYEKQNNNSTTSTTTTTTEIIWPKIPSLVNDTNDLIKNVVVDVQDVNNLKTINYRLNSLENAIREQNILIKRLNDNITLTSSSSNNNINEKNDDEFNKNLDIVLNKQQLLIGKMLENILNKYKLNECEQQQLLITNITKLFNDTLNDKLQKIIPNEIKQIILPAIRNLNETIKQQFEQQQTQKINHDIIIKDNITNLLNGKALVDSLSSSIIKVISPSLDKCYRDMISTTLIPTWEKICNNMFKQIHETFNQGTKEYTHSVETYMERQRNVQEKGKDLVGQMQTVSDKLQTSTEKLTNSLSTEIHKQFNISFKHIQDILIHNMKDIITEQVNKGFKSHASVIEDSVINAVRSRAVTPSAHVETQITLAQIEQVLSKQNYSEAFQLALSAENLNYVIHLCEKVDVNKLFQGKHLPQHVLLALIQQLSVDLSKNTEIKLNFIRPAVISLLPDHVNTKQFVPKVLKELVKQLEHFMTTNANSSFLIDAQLLKLAVERVIDK